MKLPPTGLTPSQRVEWTLVQGYLRFTNAHRGDHEVRCAWCKVRISRGKAPVSHGVCGACKDKLLEVQ